MFNQLITRLHVPLFSHLLILGMICVYALLRLGFFSGLSGDEAEQVLFAQSFQWGYDYANPPLYTWMVIALFSIVGKTAGVVVGFKLAVLTCLYFAMHQVARICLGDARRFDWSLVTLSPVLLFFVSWQAIFSYSHSLLNALFVIVTFLVVVKLIHTGQIVWYVALGVCIGLGLQTKYAFAMFLLALLGAALTLPDHRRHILDKRTLLSLAIAVVLFAPHGIWLLTSLQELQAAIAYKLEIGKDVTYIEGLALGIQALLKALTGFASPLWLVLLLVFPAALFKPTPSSTAQDVDRLLSRTFLGVLVMMVAMVLGGITQFRPNYLFLLILLPVWVFARLPVTPAPDKRRKIYAAIVVLGCVLSAGGLTAKAVTDPMRCDKCQVFMPYEAIATELKKRGFTHGSILAHWYPNPLAGNLLLYLDNTRMVSTKFPTLVPPQDELDGQCLLVTISQTQGGSDMHNMSARANEAYALDVGKDYPFTQFAVPYVHKPEKQVLIDYAIVDPGVSDCR